MTREGASDVASSAGLEFDMDEYPLESVSPGDQEWRYRLSTYCRNPCAPLPTVFCTASGAMPPKTPPLCSSVSSSRDGDRRWEGMANGGHPFDPAKKAEAFGELAGRGLAAADLAGIIIDKSWAAVNLNHQE